MTNQTVTKSSRRRRSRSGLLAIGLLVPLVCPLTIPPVQAPEPAWSFGRAASHRPNASPQGGLVLRYKAKVGAVSRYFMRMEGTTTVWTNLAKSRRSNESSIRTDMYLDQKVIAANDSTITLQTTIDSGSLDVNGAPVHGHCSGPVIAEMKSNGTILSSSGFQGLDLKSMQLVFPAVPLNVGDRWTSDIPASANVPIPLSVIYRVCGIKTLEGARCVEIRSTVRSGGQAVEKNLELTVQADGLIIFNVDDGVMVSNEVKSQMLLRVHRDNSPPVVTKMAMTMSMKKQSLAGPVDK